jgi:hypothetical protein
MMMSRERRTGLEKAVYDPPRPRLLAPSINIHNHINLVRPMRPVRACMHLLQTLSAQCSASQRSAPSSRPVVVVSSPDRRISIPNFARLTRDGDSLYVLFFFLSVLFRTSPACFRNATHYISFGTVTYSVPSNQSGALSYGCALLYKCTLQDFLPRRGHTCEGSFLFSLP